MLYYICYQLLGPYYSGAKLFQYLTFRGAMAAITAFLIGVICGKYLITALQRFQMRERTEKSDSKRLRKLHAAKSGTPTMGGLIIILAVLLATVLWARLDNFYILLAMLTMVLFGAIGFWDDMIKCFSDKKGLAGKEKLLLISLVALLLVALLWFYLATEPSQLRLFFPFFKSFAPSLTVGGGLAFLLLALIVIVGSSNAVNLTDGLDGLAIGCTIMVGSAFAVIAYLVGRPDFSHYLLLPYIPGAGELAVFCFALVGGGLAFLWYNCHPAEIFMGDTGSLPLGAALGYIAVALRQELLLFILGGVFVFEAVSVMLQVGWFKLTHKRIFLCAPFHHHWEFKGLRENKVTVRFWILSAILALFSVMTLKLR